jgi:hypothetical protein
MNKFRLVTVLVAVLALAMMTTLVAAAAVPLIQISSDPFTNTDSQHKTQVEPDSLSFGSTIVAVTQSGRYFDGGSSDIGYATSTDNGSTWTHDFLNCVTTKKANNCGTIHVYDRASDPSVAYDPKDNVWLVASLVLTGNFGAGVEVSRSTDGGLTFGLPIVVHTSGDFHDKSWIVCDTHSNSQFYGNCYIEWDDNSLGNVIEMNTSTDGGLTWGPALTAGGAGGIGGQPLVQPNGTVIVPIDNAFEGSVLAFKSTNGGASWTSPVTISGITSHGEAGGLRSGPLPSAEIDGDGRVYVVWQDCRFRSGCSANDIVMSTSTDGTSWSAVTRIPFVDTTSGRDVFIPGIAVDANSHAPNVHIAVTTYGYPVSSCGSTCQLYVGFIQSGNGGTSWSAPQILGGPMTLTWLANTNQGRMVGDYISTSIAGNGKAIPVFAGARAPSGSTFKEALISVQGGLLFPVGGPQISTLNERPVPNAHSDHPLPTHPVNTMRPIQ